MLELRGLHKRFGDVPAVCGVDFTGYGGEIVALCGENGAGKSTLAAMACGDLVADAGEVVICGRRLEPGRPGAAIDLGLAAMRQEPALADNISVAEHIALASGAGGRLTPGLVEAKAAALCDAFGLDLNPRALVRHLGAGQRQRLELAKLLARQARVFILDEPTARLAGPEIGHFLDILRGLAWRGAHVILITHKLPEALSVAGRILVMRQGKLVADVAAQSVGDPADLTALMGAPDSHGSPRSSGISSPGSDEPGEMVVFEGEGLGGPASASRPAFEDVSLRLARGQMTVIAASPGNGQTRLAECLAGLETFSHGEAALGGKRLGGRELARALRERCAYIPKDRRGEGSVADMTLAQNAALTTLGEHRPGPWFDARAAEQAAASAIRDYEIKTPGPHATAKTLSGGNLQKVIAAREIGRGLPLLVADEPAQGLDPGATGQLCRTLRQASGNAAVVVITGDAALAANLGGTVRVMYRGRLSPPVEPGPDLVQTILARMAGLASDTVTV